MLRPRVIQFVALLVCVAGLIAAATRMPGINAGRQQLNLLGPASPLEQAPPEYAFAIQAFGAFRGLIVDVAFIRAEQFKENGRFYDAMQLAKWICALQPHFPSVWEFAAWNMSWNISVTTYTPEERWQWVYNGVKLLRDQGIPKNPRAVNLYKQLAWTFNNKMSEVTDDFHYAYKCNWAWRMHLVLGPPPDPLGVIAPQQLAALEDPATGQDELLAAARETFRQNEQRRAQEAAKRGEAYEIRSLDQVTVTDSERLEPSAYRIARFAARERIRALHEAPARLTELYAQRPRARALVAGLRDLGIVLSDEPLTEDNYWRQEGLAFTFFQPYRALLDPASTMARLKQEPWHLAVQTQAEALDGILGLRAADEDGQAVVRWLQRKVLRDVYKMRTERMLEVIDNFGPVDWRSVDAAALYWVVEGLVAGGETPSNFQNDKTNTARIMFFCLRNLFLRNRITFEPYPPAIDNSYLNFGRDLNFIEPLHQAYVRYGRLFDPRPEQVGAGDTYRIGHQNLLTEAIRLLYMSGREAEAAHYYRYLQTEYRLNEAGEPNPALAKTLHNYVLDQFREIMQAAGQREARLALDGLLYAAFEELAVGNATEYVQYVDRAHGLFAEYMKDKDNRMSESKRLPPFADILGDAFTDRLAIPPASALQTVTKARLWAAAPLGLRQSVYDRLRPLLAQECEYFEFDLERAFPEPEGMAEYRQLHPERYPEQREREVETLPQTIDG